MKLERISENQIRCTLNKDDLDGRNLKLSELAYGSDNARSLFQEMMQQAFYELGFESENVPLMIEAIPVNADCIILNITKVDDPDELDQRFSQYPKHSFSSSNDDEEDDDDDDNDTDDEEKSEKSKESILDLLNEIGQELQELGSKSTPVKEEEKEKEKKEPKLKSSSSSDTILYQVFTFDNLSDVIHASKTLATVYDDQNTLYKNPIDKRYYLILFQTRISPKVFDRICSLLTEFGTKEQGTYASHIYLQEHFLPIQNHNAIQQLATL